MHGYLQKENLHHIIGGEKKIFHEQRAFGVWFLSYGLLMAKEDVRSPP